jgi:hypothetical protein
MIAGVLVFIISLSSAAGAYAWKSLLIKSQEQAKQQLAERERQFNITLIEQLKQANVKIDTARQILHDHVATSAIFDVISRLTIESVRFLSMDLTTPSAQSSGVKLDLRGYGKGFSAVAFQSDVLNKLEEYGLRKVVKNPILSDPSLDAKGTVSFGFTATIDPASISYEQLVNQSLGQSGQGATTTSTTTP